MFALQPPRLPPATLFPYTTLFRSRRKDLGYTGTLGVHPLLIDLHTHTTESDGTWTPDQLVEGARSEEHTSELQSPCNLVCRLLLEKKNNGAYIRIHGDQPDLITYR